MRRPVLLVLSVLVALAGALAAQPPQGTAPGQLRPRPGEGREPEFPAPKITDYKPRSTLVVPEHPVPRAKFPVVDMHAHAPGLNTVEGVKGIVARMDPLNLKVLVNSGPSGPAIAQTLAAIEQSGNKNRIALWAGLSFRDVGPGFGAKAAAQLEADVKAGAVGIGEVGKNLGLRTRKADGTRLALDDPELDPIWEACARLNVPAFVHFGEPSEFFSPLDFTNERWLEMALFRDRRYFDRAQNPSFEDFVAERNRMLMKHPKTTFILAHMGWQANDLGKLGALFDKLPKLHAEVGAILYDLGRQPRTAHKFFVKYQDRLLFGKDSFQPDEYPYYWRVFETEDEYFDYYRDYHAFWKLYGMNLPDPVLKKLYYQNALRVVPGLPKDGFPK
jgi:predicted TIM-barrel fold metal-dependent hydrolase